MTAAGDPAEGESRPRRTLMLFVFAALLAPMLALGALAWSDWRRLEREASVRSARTAAALAEQALRVFDAGAAALARADERARGLSWAEIRRSQELNRFLRQLVAELRVAESIGFADPEGRLAALSRVFPAPTATGADRDFFLVQVERDAGTYVGRILAARDGGGLMFLLSRRRASADGAFDGVLFAAIQPAALAGFYRTIAEPGDSVTLARADGAVLARYPEASASPAEPQGVFLRAIAIAPQRGFYRAASGPDGDDRLHAFAKVEGYPVYAAYGADPAALSREWRANLRRYVAITAFSSLLLTLVGGAALRSAEGERRALRRARAAAEAEAEAQHELGRAREREARDAIESERRAVALSEARLGAIFDSAPVGLAFAAASEGRILRANGALRRISGSDAPALLHPGGGAFSAAEHPLSRALAGEEPPAVEALCRRPEGALAWVGVTAAPVRDAAGAVTGAVLTLVDIDRERRALDDCRLLIDELNHRVKNTLAAVQSLARQTLRADRSPEEARHAFEARLMALSAVHNVLTRESWNGADLRDLLEAIAATDAVPAGRWRGEGPPVRLPPRMALPLALAFHELFSNARQHGALSRPRGDVLVSWRIDPSGAGRPTLEIGWREAGGPPPAPAAHEGFGFRVLTRNLALELDGTVDVSVPMSGFLCTIRAPLGASNPPDAPDGE